MRVWPEPQGHLARGAGQGLRVGGMGEPGTPRWGKGDPPRKGRGGGGGGPRRGGEVGGGGPSGEGTWGGGSSAVRADPGPGSVSHQRCLDFVVPDKAGAS